MKCTKAGIPIYAVLTVSLISCITFLVASNDAFDVFLWFVDLTTTALVATYCLMLVTYLFWWRARKVQGLTGDMLPYAAPLTPWAPAFALLLGCLALLFVGFDVFEPFDVRGFITSYFALMFAAVMYVVGRVKYWREGKGGLVNPKDADLYSGKAEIDAECSHWEEGGIENVEKARLAELPFMRRQWEKIW